MNIVQKSRVKWYGLFWCIVALIPSKGQAQQQDTITYTSPSQKFIDLVIASHKGLPRFGVLHPFRERTLLLTNEAYYNLVNLKYLKDSYADMDRNAITPLEFRSKGDKKMQNSIRAQKHLLTLASKISTEAELIKYFGNLTKPGLYGKKVKTDKLNFAQWGGDTQFAKRRNYTAFVKENLPELETWAETFFPKDHQLGYHVWQAQIIQSYDFKKQGYWFRLLKSNRGPLNNIGFVPLSEKEQKFVKNGNTLFFPIAAEEAKKTGWQQNTYFYLTLKVKAYPDLKKLSSWSGIRFYSELEDPILTLYSQPDLKEKVGEINMENLESLR